MSSHNAMSGTKMLLLAGVLAGGVLISSAFAQSNASPAQSASGGAAKPAGGVTSYHNRRPVPQRANNYYGLMWGVDSLTVRATESDQVIRFSYRVLDADKAKALNDKKAQPALIDPKAGVQLVVPSLEQVGQLRQSSTPEAGKSYWMAFSNKGRRVKRGDHVNVVIGKFHADGLLVD